MADSLNEKGQRSKKKRSSLSTWKKKFNIKKRFTNKLPLHGRHIRSLMSGWPMTDVRSVLNQYEISAMLKQLSLKGDKSRPNCNTVNQDLAELYQKHSCNDIRICFCDHSQGCDCLVTCNGRKEFLANCSLLAYRWPLFKSLLKSQVCDIEVQTQTQRAKAVAAQNQSSAKEETFLPVVLVPEALLDKFPNLLQEVYQGNANERDKSSTAPQKLQPLPTMEGNAHSGSKLRYSVVEAEQPVVHRRHMTRRKQKQRFSMDEQILSNLSPSASSSKMHHSRSCKFPVADSAKLSSGQHSNIYVNTTTNPSSQDIPNSMEEDLKRMYHDAGTGLGDVKIVFASESCSNFTPWLTPHSRRRDFSNHYQAWISHYESSSFYSPSCSRDWQDPVYCHRVILAARSSYFRRLIERQMSRNPRGEHSVNSPITLEIEGSVIPPRYMHALLYTMYTDQVDIQRVYERSGQHGIQLGGNLFHLRDAMMLHHIACFIEFPRLVQGCEEIIIGNLEQSNLLQVLHWTSLPHGSQWVKRQVNNFIREKFTELLSSGILYELKASQLTEILKSDYVNASELDILKCALRWGEHELLRRIEEREPNLLTHTAHSISRSKTASARRREIISSRIDELHDCTAPILACVRMQHLLPPNHEIFTNAVKRGVISRPPAYLLENVNDREANIRQWIKEKAPANFVPPRLFQPYIDETKNILDERYAQDTDCVSLRSVYNLSREQNWCASNHAVLGQSPMIPDALYMVGQARLPSQRRYGNLDRRPDLRQRSIALRFGSTPLKYIDNVYPVPDPSKLREMLTHEREIRTSATASKVLRACIDCCHSNNDIFGTGTYFGTFAHGNVGTHEDNEEPEYCNRCTAIRMIRQMVVREHDEPDCMVALLSQPELYYTVEELQVAMATESQRSSTIKPGRGMRALKNFENQIAGAKLELDLGQGVRGSHKGVSKRENTPPCFEHPPLITGNLGRATLSPRRSRSPDIESYDNDAFIYDSRENFRNDLFSTSSSEDDVIPVIRRKRKSVSRKGSSSTISHHSIPDVAASANSSLQRRRLTPVPNSTESKLSKIRRSASNSTSKPPPQTSDQCHSRLPGPLESSSSSCEENTSEIDSDLNTGKKLEQISRFRSREFYLSTHPTLSHLPETGSTVFTQSAPGTSFQIHNAGAVTQPTNDVRPKIHPRNGQISPTFSKLFSSNLNFIDDGDNFSTSEKSDLDVARDCRLVNRNHTEASTSNPCHADMPELVLDGTLPRPDKRKLCTQSSLEKPDIYPDNVGTASGSEERCGQYFFCTLKRGEKTDADGCSTSVQRTSFSFALNNQKPDKDLHL